MCIYRAVVLNSPSDHEENYQPDHQENKEKNLGDSNRGSRNTREAKQSGDKSDNQENKRPVQHDMGDCNSLAISKAARAPCD
jgi:hypothetical protein